MNHKVLMIFIRCVLVVFFCLLLIYAFVVGSRFAYDVFSDEAYQSDVQLAIVRQIEVTEGQSVDSIAESLESLHIIRDKRIFTLSLRCIDGSDDIKPGVYTVNSAMRPSDILKVLSQKED